MGARAKQLSTVWHRLMWPLHQIIRHANHLCPEVHTIKWRAFFRNRLCQFPGPPALNGYGRRYRGGQSIAGNTLVFFTVE